MAEERIPLPVTVTVANEGRYDIPDILRPPSRAHRIWLERITGKPAIDWLVTGDAGHQLLFTSALIETAIGALVVALGRDEDPDKVYAELLDSADDYAVVVLGKTAEQVEAEEKAGPTEEAASGDEPSAKPKTKSGRQTS